MQVVTVSWLPSFHDMGLIGFHCSPIVTGGAVACFSPVSFVSNPLVWLKICSQFTKVVTGGPPFALDLCVNKIKPDALDKAALDLSGFICFFLGAAPILDSTLTRFTEKFKSYGYEELPIAAVCKFRCPCKLSL